MMTIRFNGASIDSKDALRGHGLTDEHIEFIESRAYSGYCCRAFENVNYADPVIDFGTKEVLSYEALMPYLDENGKVAHRREKWKFCPFCGASLQRSLDV